MAHFFWRAFERRTDVELCVVGPYTDNKIPWAGGIEIPQKYVKVPDVPLPIEYLRFNHPPAYFIDALLPDKFRNPDLFIQIASGWNLADRPIAKVTALVKTDPHCVNYREVKSHSDYSFCMQTPYMTEGDLFLPYAVDPEIHYPMDMEKKYDACLIGLHYNNRDLLVERLRAKGLNVYYSLGEVYKEYRELYNSSKIALNWSSLLDTNSRVWEAFGMKLPLVTNHTPDLDVWFTRDVDYLGFDNVDEAVERVVRLLGDENLRKSIATCGHSRIKHQTYDDRVEQILKDTGLL